MGLHIKGKKLQACLAWNQKALACRGGGKTAPVLSLPCPTWNAFSPSALKPCQDDSGLYGWQSTHGESAPKPSSGWIWDQQNASTSTQGFKDQMQDGYIREMGSGYHLRTSYHSQTTFSCKLSWVGVCNVRSNSSNWISIRPAASLRVTSSNCIVFWKWPKEGAAQREGMITGWREFILGWDW